jgi:hypothetical protein
MSAVETAMQVLTPLIILLINYVLLEPSSSSWFYLQTQLLPFTPAVLMAIVEGIQRKTRRFEDSPRDCIPFEIMTMRSKEEGYM